MTRPLARHRFLETTDPEEARARVGELFAPHRLELPLGEKGFRTVYHHARLKTLSLYYFEYDTEVRITSGPMQRFYLLLMPVRGYCAATYGEATVPIDPGTAYVVNPFAPIALHWKGKSALRVVKIDRGELERHLEAVADAPARPPVTFAPEAAHSLDALPGLGDFVDLLFADMDEPVPALSSRAGEGSAEAMLLTLLLRRYPNSAQPLLDRPGARAAPYYVKRVEEFIRLHAEEGPSLDAMVRIAGVSARTLFKGFRDFRGIGPVGYLKQVRLDRVRAEIAAARPGDTVTGIAGKWGFHHLGNFARDYRERFGETPSATLREARHTKDALLSP